MQYSDIEKMDTRELRTIKSWVTLELKRRTKAKRAATVPYNESGGKKRFYTLYVLMLEKGKFYIGITSQKVDKRSIYLINQYLALREDDNEAMFVTLQGDRLCTDKIREVFSCTSAHFTKKVHPHMLRHSFATNLLENGCHPYTMQRLMRHSTFLSTQKYLHIVDKELEQAHNKYHK